MALVLEADGRRENGRWKRGSVDNQGFLNSDWKNKISQAGTVLEADGRRENGRWEYGALDDNQQSLDSLAARLRQAGTVLDWAQGWGAPRTPGPRLPRKSAGVKTFRQSGSFQLRNRFRLTGVVAR